MTGLGERLYRLHQLVEVEAGLENLAVLEVEVIGIGKDDQYIGGLCAEATCSKSKRKSESADGFHVFLHAKAIPKPHGQGWLMIRYE